MQVSVVVIYVELISPRAAVPALVAQPSCLALKTDAAVINENTPDRMKIDRHQLAKHCIFSEKHKMKGKRDFFFKLISFPMNFRRFTNKTEFKKIGDKL